MASAEIETYKQQLSQVEAALEVDPSNAEFQTLKTDLESLIALSESLVPNADKDKEGKQSVGKGSEGTNATNVSKNDNSAKKASANRRNSPPTRTTASPISPTTASPHSSHTSVFSPKATDSLPITFRTTYKVGDKILARTRPDQPWMEAKVLNVSSNQQRTTYTVEFLKDSRGTSQVDMANVREMPHGWHVKRRAAVMERSGTDDDFSAADSNTNSSPSGASAPPRKKSKTGDRSEAQNAWQKFARGTRGGRGAKAVGGLPRRSMFATPDEVDGRVGVTGSGRGVTKYADRKRYEVRAATASASMSRSRR